MSYYEVQNFCEKVYRITSEENVYTELIIGRSKALVLDTGYGFGPLREQIAELTELPLIVVNSHSHLDHTGGNHHFSDCDIFIHPEDMVACISSNSPELRRGAVERARKTRNFHTGAISDILPEHFDEDGYVSKGAGVLRSLTQGQVFDLGGVTLETVELQGHTRGSIGLLWQEERLLFAGDAMNPFLWLFMPDAEKLSVYKDSLHRAAGMAFDHFLMAHNPVVGTKNDIACYLDCAENLDFDAGVPFNPDIPEAVDARICPRAGFAPMEFGRPGFASIVISREKLG